MKNSFGTLSTLDVAGARTGSQARRSRKEGFSISRLPYALRILLENLLRCEDGFAVTAEQIEALARWNAKAEPSREIAFTPAAFSCRTSRACRRW